MPLIDNLFNFIKKEIIKKQQANTPHYLRTNTKTVKKNLAHSSYNSIYKNTTENNKNISQLNSKQRDINKKIKFKNKSDLTNKTNLNNLVDEQIKVEELSNNCSIKTNQKNKEKLTNNKKHSNITDNKITKRDRGLIKIKVLYQDENGNNLSPAVIISGKYKSPLKIKWKTFPGYVLSQTINYQQTFFRNEDGIKLIYSHQQAAPIIVYHKTLDGNLIAPPQYIEGDLNSNYKIEPLKDFQNSIVHKPKELTGKFSKKSKILSFIYEPNGLQYNKLEKQMFIKIHKKIKPRLMPCSDNIANITLPVGSVWKVFQLAYNPKTDNIWLDIGGSEWIINNESIESLNENPNILPADIPLGLPQVCYTIIKEIDLNKYATINMDHKHRVVVWATPYGDIQPTGISGETNVKILKTIVLENNSSWSQMADGLWIETHYLTFNKN